MVIATSLETTCNRGCFNLFFCPAPNGGILPLIRSARWSRRCSRRDDPSTGGWPLQPELWLINGHSMAATQDGGIGRWLFTKEVWDGIPCGDGYFFVFSMMFSWSVSLNYFHNWRQWEEEEQKISRNQLISWVSRHWDMPRKRLTNEQHRYDGMIVIFPSTRHHVIALSLTCLWPQVLRERRMLVPKPLSLSQVPWRFLKYCGVRIAVKKTLLKQKQRNACRTQKTSKLLFLLFPKNALRY